MRLNPALGFQYKDSDQEVKNTNATVWVPGFLGSWVLCAHSAPACISCFGFLFFAAPNLT